MVSGTILRRGSSSGLSRGAVSRLLFPLVPLNKHQLLYGTQIKDEPSSITSWVALYQPVMVRMRSLLVAQESVILSRRLFLERPCCLFRAFKSDFRLMGP